ASLCGVVGFKPTYGRVSRYGLVAFASSLDQIGPITIDVEDCAMMLQAISGYDRRDSTSIDRGVPDYAASLKKGVRGLTFGLPKEYMRGGLEPAVEKSVCAAIDLYKKLGAEIVDISLPHTDYAIATYYILATAEASANLARYDGVKYGYRAGSGDGVDGSDLIGMYEATRSKGFGPEVKRRIILGTYVLSSGYYDAYYLKAQRVRTLLKRDFDEAFKKCDCILTPTAPTCAFKVGEKADDPLQMYLSDIFTISINLAGIPAVSVPCGFSEKNLPVGLQILGKHFDEETILRAAYAFEQNSDFCNKMPDWLV
ncbi:MAG TPA: amidase family protein, partial [bacterium]|nr:amidase family protein [bacterium]